jgi:hypothetical protein
VVDAVSFCVVGVGVSEVDEVERVEEDVEVEVVVGAEELMELDELEVKLVGDDWTCSR